MRRPHSGEQLGVQRLGPSAEEQARQVADDGCQRSLSTEQQGSTKGLASYEHASSKGGWVPGRPRVPARQPARTLPAPEARQASSQHRPAPEQLQAHSWARLERLLLPGQRVLLAKRRQMVQDRAQRAIASAGQ